MWSRDQAPSPFGRIRATLRFSKGRTAGATVNLEDHGDGRRREDRSARVPAADRVGCSTDLASQPRCDIGGPAITAGILTPTVGARRGRTCWYETSTDSDELFERHVIEVSRKCENTPMTLRLLATAASLLALTSGGVAYSPADPRTGYVLVANQQSASASLIDLSTDTAQDHRGRPGAARGGHCAERTRGGRDHLRISGAPGNQLAVLDVAKGAVTKTISLGQYTRPHGAMFFPGDETRVAVTSEATQNVVLVNIAAGTVEDAIPTGAAGSHMVAITADGKRAFTSDIGAGAVSELDLVKKELVRVIPVAPRVEGIAVTPDGSAVWAGSNTDGTVSIIDTRTGTIVETLKGFKLPYRLAMSADGKTAIVCDPEGDMIHVADVAARKIALDPRRPRLASWRQYLARRQDGVRHARQGRDDGHRRFGDEKADAPRQGREITGRCLVRTGAEAGAVMKAYELHPFEGFDALRIVERPAAGDRRSV